MQGEACFCCGENTFIFQPGEYDNLGPKLTPDEGYCPACGFAYSEVARSSMREQASYWRKQIRRGLLQSPVALQQVLWQIVMERKRQDEKWGERDHSAADWILIIGEEFGELCKACLEGKGAGREAIQVAASAVAFVEELHRKGEL